MRHHANRAPRVDPNQPPCARCGADEVLISGPMPATDAFGRPVVIQLCGVCDADAPAGGPLVQFFRTGGDNDPSRLGEFEKLADAWMKEAMAARGFRKIPMPGGGPSLS